MRLALKGDQVAHMICIDIKTAIHTKGVLTFKQKRYLNWWWQGYEYVEIAAMYHKDPSVIQRRVELAISNISKHLTKKAVLTH